MIFPREYNLIELTNIDEFDLYLILDGATFENISSFIYEIDEKIEWRALYKNSFYESVIEVSPCIIKIDINSLFFKWYIEEGYFKSIMIRSKNKIDEVVRHLQYNIEARLPNLEIVIFRFYDPIILDTYIRNITSEDAKRFFGPISEIIWKTENTYYSIENNPTSDILTEQDFLIINEDCHEQLLQSSLERYAKTLKNFNEQNNLIVPESNELDNYVSIIKYAREHNIKTDSGIKLYSIITAKFYSNPVLTDEIAFIMEDSSLLELEKLIKLYELAEI